MISQMYDFKLDMTGQDMDHGYTYDQVTNYLDMVIFFLKKLLWGPRRPKIRDFGYHGP
jgi:hypothetical protein